MTACCAILETNCQSSLDGAKYIWEFRKIGDTILGVPIVRISILEPILGSPILGKHHISQRRTPMGICGLTWAAEQKRGLMAYRLRCCSIHHVGVFFFKVPKVR